MTAEELDLLIARAASGELSAEEGATLMAACREDQPALARLASVVTVERLLPLATTDATGVMMSREVLLRIEAGSGAVPVQEMATDATWRTMEKIRQSRARRRLAWIATCTTLIIATVAGSLWAFRPQAPAATLMSTEAVQWAANHPALTVGQAIPQGTRLRAEAGLIEVSCASGTRMVLEAPVDVEIHDSSSAYLNMGRASIRCSGASFTLATDQGEVVEHGGRFCVAVPKQGKMEVHVLEGSVDTVLKGGAKSTLFGGEGMRVTEGKPQQLSSNGGGFITDMPSPSGNAHAYVHWSLDEGKKTVARDSGRGLSEGSDSSLRLVTWPENTPQPGKGPQWIPGKFGNALSFDGETGFAQSGFPGIGGGDPRTVAMWVRVPKDFKTNQGFGFISWGAYGEGGAWQISANPRAAEGPQGRLRIGTSIQGFAIGTTDLRDGKWHHIAVVTYGSPHGGPSSNVLMYVDGKPEIVSRKTLSEINTDIRSAGHGVWIARNLGFFAKSKSNPSGKFFRGDIDEIYIFNEPLSHDQIVALMQKNTPPK